MNVPMARGVADALTPSLFVVRQTPFHAFPPCATTVGMNRPGAVGPHQGDSIWSIMKEEILGWRDQGVSERHRTYGFDCPAVDLDFVVVEYDTGLPKGLVDLKFSCHALNTDHPSHRAVAWLASGRGLPYFVAEYHVDSWTYKLWPINPEADEFLDQHGVHSEQRISEFQYVTLLYALRGKPLPPDVGARLSRWPRIKPPSAEPSCLGMEA